MHDIKPIQVPQYETYSRQIYARVKGYIENFVDYFPDYENYYVP